MAEVSRRSFLLGGLGTAATVGVGLALADPAAEAAAGTSRRRAVAADAITGTKIKDLTGPAQTGQFGAPWTDLGIPARCPNGTLFFLCGDTFDGPTEGSGNWKAPVGLRSSSTNLNSVTIDGAVGGSDATELVPEGHTQVGNGYTTAIPSDIFTIGNTMYMHLMRGVIYQTDHSDFWQSTDNGNTWTYLCQWPGDTYGGQFQQKTYAVADDGYCYVFSSVFDRDTDSGLLLHRVPQSQVGTPSAYQPWGYANGGWAWGNAPTTVSPTTRWGEICFRAMDGKYAFTWFDPASGGIQAQVFALPTSDLYSTPKQQLIYPASPSTQGGNAVAANYGGFIFPGATFDSFDIAVSQWYDNTDYRVMQFRISGLSS